MSTTHGGRGLSWGVVGGGLLGLTVAHRLAARGERVTVLEAADRLGGLASAWRLGDVTWDRHYHVILLSDLALRGLLDELDLAEELRWVTTRTGFYVDDELVSMSNALEFLRFPPLTLLDKVRLGGTIAYAARVKDWRRLERVPVARWLRRLSGPRTFERIWLPLLRSKLGEAYTRTSAAFIWATIARMYAARRTGLKREMFGYVRGGYARVLERFDERLRERGVTMRLGARVREVRPAAGGAGLTVEIEGAEPLTFDRVVVTAPAPTAARLCPALPPHEAALSRGVEYMGIVCASLLLRRPLAGYYVTNLTDGWEPFTAVIELTALVDRAETGGHALVYLPKYVEAGDAILDEPEESIRARFVGALERMYPGFDGARDVLAFRLSRVRHVFPLPTLGYSERLPPIQTGVPGLALVSSAHILHGTLNVNETVQLADRVVAELTGSERHES